ncbi:MAG: hypothetical protein QOE82_1430 [Thermoanaerobaculia bacterium]|nr:hypothetical protein [Thermoanaerobaculia bacterium]
MASFENTLRAVNAMKEAGIIADYAVAGAMALMFWIEPVPTFDLDVLVFLPSTEPLVSLEPIYRWAADRGYTAEHEHLIIDGVPVQFLPSYSELSDEAIRTAVHRDYRGVDVRVVTPEYLVALYLVPSARTLKRQERAAALRDSAAIDSRRLADVMARFNLTF